MRTGARSRSRRLVEYDALRRRLWIRGQSPAPRGGVLGWKGRPVADELRQPTAVAREYRDAGGVGVEHRVGACLLAARRRQDHRGGASNLRQRVWLEQSTERDVSARPER